MKEYNQLKLKDLKSGHYLLLIDDMGCIYVKEFTDELKKTEKLIPNCKFYQGLFIIDKFPKEWFKRLIHIEKINDKRIEMRGGMGYAIQELYLIELNRFLEIMENNRFICSIKYEKIKEILNQRILRIRKKISNYNGCNDVFFNALTVDLNCRGIYFTKDNIVITLQNDYENIFRIFKKEIYDDKEIRYKGKTIFHHELLV